MKTGSGATAVQVVEKRSGVRRILEHLGSAHVEAGQAALVRSARSYCAGWAGSNSKAFRPHR